MLFPEIEPYADAHIAELDKVREFLKTVQLNLEDTDQIEEVRENLNRLNGTRNALVRFKACAIDEWKMKERLETKVRECRLNHK